jgi:hypothetical protein
MSRQIVLSYSFSALIVFDWYQLEVFSYDEMNEYHWLKGDEND